MNRVIVPAFLFIVNCVISRTYYVPFALVLTSVVHVPVTEAATPKAFENSADASKTTVEPKGGNEEKIVDATGTPNALQSEEGQDKSPTTQTSLAEKLQGINPLKSSNSSTTEAGPLNFANALDVFATTTEMSNTDKFLGAIGLNGSKSETTTPGEASSSTPSAAPTDGADVSSKAPTFFAANAADADGTPGTPAEGAGDTTKAPGIFGFGAGSTSAAPGFFSAKAGVTGKTQNSSAAPGSTKRGVKPKTSGTSAPRGQWVDAATEIPSSNKKQLMAEEGLGKSPSPKVSTDCSSGNGQSKNPAKGKRSRKPSKNTASKE